MKLADLQTKVKINITKIWHWYWSDNENSLKLWWYVFEVARSCSCVFCILCCVPLIISWWGHITRWNKHTRWGEREGEAQKHLEIQTAFVCVSQNSSSLPNHPNICTEKWNNRVFVVFYWKLSTIYCNVNNINFVIAIRTVEWTTG